jgi:hypothetical protein
MIFVDIMARLRAFDPSCSILWWLRRYPGSGSFDEWSPASRWIVEIDNGFDPSICLYGATELLDKQLIAPADAATGDDYPEYRLECLFEAEQHTIERLVAGRRQVNADVDDIVRRYLRLRMSAAQRRQTVSPQCHELMRLGLGVAEPAT